MKTEDKVYAVHQYLQRIEEQIRHDCACARLREKIRGLELQKDEISILESAIYSRQREISESIKSNQNKVLEIIKNKEEGNEEAGR